MNLIRDEWLPVIRASGKKDKIAPWQIAEMDDPVIELHAPRPDFQGALYQFLIGLLQTCFAPGDSDEWEKYWKTPPDIRLLQTKFMKVASAFRIECGDDFPALPLFMQEPYLAAEEKKEISGLLIDAPGDKTIRENLDHFIKRNTVVNMCKSCAATALFTIQINAPAGGVGHRVGLRGGGPLTTLILPTEETTLWCKLWLNVLDIENYVNSIEQPTQDAFPWMGKVRISDKDGVDTRPEDAHALQAYWGMPRRIKLIPSVTAHETCDLCGAHDSKLIKDYFTRNYGINYVGEWVHPLTPYRFDAKKENPPLSIKGQKGGLGYRHWVSLVLAHSDYAESAAKIVKIYMSQRAREIGSQRIARLWCFGYDMDNMKARCWYDHTLPLFHLDSTQRDNVLSWASDLINAAWDVTKNLRIQVKAAWFRRPGDVKGDMGSLVQEFWEKSEPVFYQLLEQLTNLPGDQRLAPAIIYAEWLTKLQTLAYSLFDAWALNGTAEDLDMKRIVAARNELKSKLNGSKPMKELIAKANIGKGGKNAANSTVSLP